LLLIERSRPTGYEQREGNMFPLMSERPFIAKLLCIAVVAAVMLPLGGLLFPYVSAALSRTEFTAIEAVFSASAGFGLYGILS
jgi:hypothetical protein